MMQQTMAASEISTAAQRQYFARPADERFSDLDSLIAKVENRRSHAIEVSADVIDLKATTSPNTGLIFQAKTETMIPTHYAFGQMASLIGAPASYLRTLAAQGNEALAIECLNHGIAKRVAGQGQIKMLAVDEDNDATTLYAATSPTYGRIWDADIAGAVKQAVDAQDGKFYSPWAWGKKHRALFASAQDIFLYYIDGGSIVDGGGDRDQLHRGFYVWNSEVGAATFGLATFLFRETCGNFCVWGVQNARILNIRHTSGGPERFVAEARPALKAFAESSVGELEANVRAAKAFALPLDPDDILTFGTKNGFSRAEVKRAIATANTEEGQCATLWDLINGFTATARMMAHADAKADMERRAGKLMAIVV